MGTSLPTARRPIRATAVPPPSKSITHRALVAASLADAPTRLLGPLASEDTGRTAAGLEQLGAKVLRGGPEWRVVPFPAGLPVPSPDARIDAGDSGTTLRLLLALAALGDRDVVLDGSARLRERPVAPLGSALESLGARIHYEGRTGHAPVRVRGPITGGAVRIDASESSQYVSALLLASAGMACPLEMRVTGLASRPYVGLTQAVLSGFGVEVDEPAPGTYRTDSNRPVSRGAFRIEADASAAAFLLAAGVVTGGRVRVEGVGSGSRQGDTAFLDLLEQAGCRIEGGPGWMAAEGPPRSGLSAVLTDLPDLVPPLSAVALFAPTPSRFTGIAHLRLKESDRLDALAAELDKLGADVTAGSDFLAIRPAPLSGAEVSARRDHRIAMALAIAALVVPGVRLDDTACVAKSWPGFFEDLRRLL